MPLHGLVSGQQVEQSGSWILKWYATAITPLFNELFDPSLATPMPHPFPPGSVCVWDLRAEIFKSVASSSSSSSLLTFHPVVHVPAHSLPCRCVSWCPYDHNYLFTGMHVHVHASCTCHMHVYMSCDSILYLGFPRRCGQDGQLVGPSSTFHSSRQAGKRYKKDTYPLLPWKHNMAAVQNLK